MKKQIILFLLAAVITLLLPEILSPSIDYSISPISTTGPFCNAIGCNIKNASMRVDRGWPVPIYQESYYEIYKECAIYTSEDSVFRKPADLDYCKKSATSSKNYGFNIFSFLFNSVVIFVLFNIIMVGYMIIKHPKSIKILLNKNYKKPRKSRRK